MNEDVKDLDDGGQAATTALTTQASPDQMTANMARMQTMLELKRRFLNENLQKGIDRDYAEIPGTNKPSLLKPGAEKLLDWHGYYATFKLTSEKEDWAIGLFAYTYRCEVRQRGSNVMIADCEGDASSYESKYRFEWKYESELPAGLDKAQLVKKQFGSRENPYFKYQVIIANAADKRNTIRKMAQKRALIGATVLATATSDLFAADAEPPDEDQPTQTTGTGEQQQTPPTDMGHPISEKQGKRLYAIRKGKNIADATFKAWLKAKYGIEDDRNIGSKVYDEIVAACESGNLQMPASKPAAADPAQPATTAQPASGGLFTRITVPQIKDLNMLINSLGNTEAHFKEWLHIAFPTYEGKGINDLMADDVDYIKEQYVKYCEGEKA